MTDTPLSDSERRWFEALDVACGYYRREIKAILEHCDDDNANVALLKIREHASDALRAADAALEAAHARVEPVVIFAPVMAAAISQGRKTVTRRPRRLHEECRYHVGRSYAVQLHRGGFAVDRIMVLSVQPDELRPLDMAEARREGFASSPAFEAHWRALHGACVLGTPVWRIEFRLEDGS